MATSVVALNSRSRNSSPAVGRGPLGIVPSSALRPLGSRVPPPPVGALPAPNQALRSPGRPLWCCCHSCWSLSRTVYSFPRPSLTFPAGVDDLRATTSLPPYRGSSSSLVRSPPLPTRQTWLSPFSKGGVRLPHTGALAFLLELGSWQSTIVTAVDTHNHHTHTHTHYTHHTRTHTHTHTTHTTHAHTHARAHHA